MAAILLQQNIIVLTGTMAISMHECVDRNRHFKPNYVFSNPNQVFVAPTPNRAQTQCCDQREM